MKAYPETSLDDKLAPGETDEPFPLRSQAEALKAQPAPWTIIGEARRRADGAYAAADELGPSEALAEALQSLAAAGIDPALRAVILLVGPSAEGEGAWFEWTHDGSLLINAGGLGDAAQAAQVRRTDVLIQLLARYALGPGRPRSSRLSPAELEKAGIWPGSALSEEQVLAAARRARRSLGGWSAMRWAAGAAVAALTAFGFALFYSLRDMLNAGFIVPAETPNLLGPTLLLLPALWPLMTWLLRAIRRSFDLLEAGGFAPKTGQVSDSARSTHDAVSGRKRNLAFSILPLAFYAGAAFLEEYLFRYLLFHGLGSWAAAAWGIPLFAVLPGAALAAAAVFAVYHFGNWKHLTFKQGAGLILYYGSAALLFSVIYWVSGIWVAAFVHLYYNVRVAGGEAAEEEAAPAQAQPAAPDLRAAWAEAPAEPRLALAGDLLQQRVALLVEAAGKSLPEADKRALLGELASGAFLGSRALSIGFEESDPVLNLKRDLAKRKRLSERGFQRLLHLFLEELPPQLLRPALAYTLERWRAPIERELSEARKAGLTPQLESFRIALESSISASLGAPARVRPFAGESLLRVDPQWSWPLVRAGPEGAEFWISERALYAMAAAPGPWAPELAQMALAARQGGGPLAALKAADFPAYAGLVKAVEPTIETHKPWLARYKPYFLWSMAALWLGTQLLPLAKLLWLAPAAGLAELGARLAAFGANFADPLFAGVFLATLAIDWGTKWWVNRRLPQVDHREFYKAHVGELTLPGGAKWRFTNVLHFVELPRLLFSVLLPVVLVLGGINAAANPVFAAILLAGALGNLGELFLRHGATDWIPLPFGVANAADFAIVLAMAGPWLLAIPELPIGLAIGFLVHRVVLPAFRSWREKRQAAKAAVTAEPTPALDALATGARGYAPEAKSYALSESTLSDLDVFGDEIGLYKTIDKTRTAFGAKRLEHMLRNPSLDIAEIRARQDAVRELLQDEELRKEVEAAFADLGGKADSGLRQDALEPRSEGKAGFHVFGNLLGMWPLALFFIPLRAAAQVIFLPIYLGGGILTVLNRLRETFLRYKAAFRLASRLRSRLAAGRSERLREIGGAFAAVDDPAHPQEFTATARSFSRLLPTSIGSVLDFLYFHGAKTLWWLSRRFARDRERIARVLAALGELDAYLSLAKVALENERWRTFPVLREAEKASLTIEGGHHPALAGKETSVPNGVRLDADPAAQGGEV
ncbi:MAG TPA: signal peptidase II, partial [Elusimicrobiota bacterium]|nr:signal peptidase II [Elusimicrobiota bacterium]